jgi:CheY-like chemotaxis protein
LTFALQGIPLKLAIVRTTTTTSEACPVGDIECAYRNTSKNKKGSEKRKKKKIAIIEDFVDLSKIYSIALALHGHEVVFVGKSGEEAVKALSSGKLGSVECAIIDYKMKGRLDGLEVANRISNSNREVRIAVASADFSIKETVEAIGFKFLRKPFAMSDLLDWIDQENTGSSFSLPPFNSENLGKDPRRNRDIEY